MEDRKADDAEGVEQQQEKLHCKEFILDTELFLLSHKKEKTHLY